MRLNQLMYPYIIHGSESVGPIHVFKEYVKVQCLHIITCVYIVKKVNGAYQKKELLNRPDITLSPAVD